MLKQISLIIFAVCIALTSVTPVHAQDTLPPIQRLGTGIPTSIAASPDGKTLAVGSSIGVWLMDAETLQPIGFWDTGFWVETVVYSQDGLYLNTGNSIIDTSTSRAVSADVNSITWQSFNCSSDGLFCSKESAKYWTAYKGERGFAHNKVIYSTIVFNTQTLIDLQVLHGPTLDVAWSPDNRMLYTVVSGTIEKWDVSTWTVTRELDSFFGGGFKQVIWSDDSQQIASGKAVWNVATAQISGQRGCTGSVEFDCPILSNQFVNSSPLSFSPHHFYTQSRALSSDGLFYVTSGVDELRDCTKNYLSSCETMKGSVKVWDTQTKALLGSVPTFFYDLAVSPDARLVAGHSYDGDIELWDWQNGYKRFSITEEIGYQCPINHAPDFWCLDKSYGTAFSPSGKYLATYANAVDTNIRLWDTTTGQLVATLVGHTAPKSIPLSIYEVPRSNRAWLDEVAPITGIAFSPDGSKIAASSGDGTILIWAVP
jgi:WD40 repeat protein